MSRLSAALNINAVEIKTRAFEYHGQQFRVRIPTLGEIESFESDLKVQSEDKAKLEELYQKRKDQFKEDQDVVIKDDEVWVKERPLRDIVKAEYIGRIRITWLFNLLETKVDDGLGALTYEDISEELPMSVQTDIIELISKAMSPELEEVKKNSLETPAVNSTSTALPTQVGQST